MQFFKPTIAKIVLTLLLPTFWIITDIIRCICQDDSACNCPPPFTYKLLPLPWALSYYFKFEADFPSTYSFATSFIIGLLASYFISCVIVYGIKKCK